MERRENGQGQATIGRSQLTRAIRQKATELGFDGVGIARAAPVPGNPLADWLARGFHGQMHYMQRTATKRADPGEVLPNVRSIISLLLNYRHPYPLPYHQPQKAVISRYASGDDYHDVMEKRLGLLWQEIQGLQPEANGKIYVDSGPVMDKFWASQAGVGWLGKHTNVLSRQQGSWFFLGEILLDLELDYDAPQEDFCGSCTRCIEACPTDAIVAPYQLDSRRCIAYLTIELREEIPEELRPDMGNLIFGCDICQDVCPWNHEGPLSSVEEFRPREENRAPELRELARLSPEEFSRRFRASPIKRAKWRGFMRNVAIAMGNSRDPVMIPELKRLLVSGDGLIEQHARWALRQIGTAEALEAIAPDGAAHDPDAQ